MSLIAAQLDAVYDKFKANAPDAVKGPLIQTREDLLATYDASSAVNVGDKLPSFTLPDAVGKEQNSDELLSQGPLVITFYRGEWCPFCNIALSGFQKHLDEFKAKGVNIVAITPEKPNNTLSVTEKHELRFAVVTDLHNEYAHKLGIVWKQPENLRPIFEKLNHNLEESNGDDSFELPIPATYLVDKTGTVRNAYLNPDWTKRAEPKTILKWIDEL